MTKRRIKAGTLIIIIIIAACIIAYVFVFHIPRPILSASEIIIPTETTMSYTDIDGNETVERYPAGTILVESVHGGVVATIEQSVLEAALKNTTSLREINAPTYIVLDDYIYSISIVTNKGPLHLMIGDEKSFWYRDGGDPFRNVFRNNEKILKGFTPVG